MVVALKRKNLDLEKTSSIIKLQKKIKKNDIVFFIAANAPVKTFKQFDKNMKICSNICESLIKKKVKKLIYLAQTQSIQILENLLTRNLI